MAGLGKLAKRIRTIAKEKTPEQEFLFLLHETMQRTENIRQPSRSYKPSSLGGCMRMNYFQIVGAPVDKHNPTEGNMIGIQEAGTDAHERIQGHIVNAKKAGFDLEWIDVETFLKTRPVQGTRVISKNGHETKLFNDVLELSFMCDGIIKMNGQYYILEIKTEVSFKWQGRTQPEAKHVVQATAYSTALGINKIMFLYVNRDNFNKKTFLHEVEEQDKYDKVVHYIEECNSYVARQEVPAMSANKKDCTYCKFKSECKEVGE